MTDPMALDADAILAIPDDRPGFLFSGSAEGLAGEYRGLVNRWHPDRNTSPLAVDVMQKIGRLRAAADANINGLWISREEIIAHGVDGKRRTVRYLRLFDTDVGMIAYGLGTVTSIVRPEFKGLFAAGLSNIAALKYPSARIETEMRRYMPNVITSFEVNDGSMVLLQRKTPDVFRLRDFITAMDGFVDPRHVAWIINCALNIACYFGVIGMVHGAISIDSFYVSPKYHSGLMLGDWWYALRYRDPISWLPRHAHRYLNGERKANPNLDLALIRSIGRSMLGDETGMSLIADTRVPRPMVDWLRSAPAGLAIDDYRVWKDVVLPACFGPRRFLKLDLDAAQVFAAKL